jgi:hypothetical protein
MPEVKSVAIIHVSKRAEDGTSRAYEVEVLNSETGEELDFYFANWDECRAQVASIQSLFSEVTIHYLTTMEFIGMSKPCRRALTSPPLVQA